MAEKVKISIEVDKKTGAIKVAGQELDGFGKQAKRSGDKAKAAAGGFDDLKNSIGGILAVGAIVGFFRESVQAATDLQEVQAKFETVFRQNVEQAEGFAQNLVENFNVSEQAAKEYLASIQDTLVPMGLARQEAADLSNEIVKLASDLGSFNNVPTADVVRDLQSALVGNTETVKKYGVVLRASDIQQRALAESGKKSADSLTNAEKVVAAYKLVLEGTSDAQGDVARTNDSFANRSRNLQARLKDLSAVIGTELQPALGNIIESLTNGTESFNEFGRNVGKSVGTVIVAFKSALDIVSVTLTALGEVVGLQAANIRAIIVGAFAGFKSLLTGNLQGFKDAIDEAINAGATAAREGVAIITRAGRDIVEKQNANGATLKAIWATTNDEIVNKEKEAAGERGITDDALTEKKLANAAKVAAASSKLGLEITEIESGKFEADRARLAIELEEMRALGVEKVNIKRNGIEQEISLDEAFAIRRREIDKAEEKQLVDNVKKDLARRKKAEELKHKLSLENRKRAEDGLNALVTLTKGKSQELNAIAKAAAITNALRSTFEGANKALGQGGFFGFAMASAVIAAGMANVAKIQGFAEGGRVTKPVLGLIGEGGESETVVPDSKAEGFAMGVQAAKGGGGARLGPGGTGAVAGQVAVNFTGGINITIEAVDLTDPTRIREIAIGLAQELQNETQEAITLARRSADTNENNAERAV